MKKYIYHFKDTLYLWQELNFFYYYIDSQNLK